MPTVSAGPELTFSTDLPIVTNSATVTRDPIKNYFDARMNIKEIIANSNSSPTSSFLNEGIAQVFAIVIAITLFQASSQPASANVATLAPISKSHDASVVRVIEDRRDAAAGTDHVSFLLGTREWQIPSTQYMVVSFPKNDQSP